MKTQINVLKGFTFTFPNGEKETFAPGLREIDDQFAEHFFVKAHCGETSTDGDADLRHQLDLAGAALSQERTRASDLFTELQSVGDELAVERLRANDLTAQLAAERVRTNDLTAQLDTANIALTGGAEAMNALATANNDLTAQLAAATKKK